jgi:hypothetical protein
MPEHQPLDARGEELQAIENMHRVFPDIPADKLPEATFTLKRYVQLAVEIADSARPRQDGSQTGTSGA